MRNFEPATQREIALLKDTHTNHKQQSLLFYLYQAVYRFEDSCVKTICSHRQGTMDDLIYRPCTSFSHKYVINLDPNIINFIKRALINQNQWYEHGWEKMQTFRGTESKFPSILAKFPSSNANLSNISYVFLYSNDNNFPPNGNISQVPCFFLAWIWRLSSCYESLS